MTRPIDRILKERLSTKPAIPPKGIYGIEQKPFEIKFGKYSFRLTWWF